MAPPPTPTTEHRNLSITRANQQMSPLLRLPAELRTYIWEYTFIGSIVKMNPPGHGSKPHRNIQPNIDQATGLLRACIQSRREALPFFVMHCTFDLDWILNWPPGKANNIRMTIEAVKNIQLAKISEDTIRYLLGQEGPVRRFQSVGGWKYYPRIELLASFPSLRQLVVDNSSPSLLPYPPTSLQEVFIYSRDRVVSYSRATVHGIQHMFNNDSLDVLLGPASENEDED